MAPSTTEKVLTSTDGKKIYAKAVGDSSKPSIIFIHGLTLSAAVWDDIFTDNRLLDKFYLVAYDMRGHGRSAKPLDLAGHSSSLYADDFAAVCKAFGLSKPILLGWSLGATVAADVCTHLGKDAISGVVYVTALPYIGPIMNEVGTSTVLGFLPGLFTTEDLALSRETKLLFLDSLFNDPESVPVSLKWQWLGSAVLQAPEVSQLVLSREQDPAKLFEAGEKGLPLLIINGSNDKQVKGDAVVSAMKAKFVKTTAETIEGGSHALFVDNRDEFIKVLIKWAITLQNA
ncbi:hypothetical protein M422DRAFT_230170 [Sphaerobolus stellatus SS14]|uniref:AB hydrolase-1 domain-containing protein n=1 Tax=Sphaerobolus stellatus (strain SS14) TaxID=990650 RepID=A0A0C9UBA2_SPHS4|nr:hypothetical protein M422DRAFT_230170 [Sphaerobolus stellatus SS14]